MLPKSLLTALEAEPMLAIELDNHWAKLFYLNAVADRAPIIINIIDCIRDRLKLNRELLH